MKSKSLKVDEPKQKLSSFLNIQKDKLAGDEVLVKVMFCGICHTDVHEIDNDWDRNKDFYPFIPGHEIIGRIEKVGSNVKDKKVGDVVGVGWQSACCGKCFACLRGWRNICENGTPTYNNLNGGFQNYVISQSAFAVKIPKKLQRPEATPLLCGGITVFNPLVLYDVKPKMKTLVIGMGGLGHMAVKFMSALGCDVSVVSRDGEKKKDAIKFGARKFYQSLDAVDSASLDFILVCTPEPIDSKLAIKKLRAHGKLCVVGAITKDLTFNPFDMLDYETSIGVASIGDPKTIEMMLDLAAKNNITAQSEIYSPEAANEVIQKVRDGKVRYRAVLDFQNF